MKDLHVRLSRFRCSGILQQAAAHDHGAFELTLEFSSVQITTASATSVFGCSLHSLAAVDVIASLAFVDSRSSQHSSWLRRCWQASAADSLLLHPAFELRAMFWEVRMTIE